MDLLEGDEKTELSRRTLAAGLSAPDRRGAGEFNSSRGGDAGGQFSSPADGNSELQALILGGKQTGLPVAQIHHRRTKTDGQRDRGST